MRKRRYVAYLYMIPGVLMVLGFVYIPVIVNVMYSFYRLSSYSAGQVFVGLDNYRRFFSDRVFPIMLKNNSAYAIISLIIQVGFGTTLAMVLESGFIGKKTRNLFRNVYYVPALISLTAVGLMFTFIYEPNIGFINRLLEALNLPTQSWLGDSGLAIYSIIAMSQWQFTGYITLLMVVAIQAVPQDYLEAAAIDGASPFRQAISIKLPYVKEQLLVCSIITIIGAFKLYTEVYATTSGGPGNSSQVLGLYLYQQAFLHDELGMAAVTGVFVFLITITLSILQIKLARSGKQ